MSFEKSKEEMNSNTNRGNYWETGSSHPALYLQVSLSLMIAFLNVRRASCVQRIRRDLMKCLRNGRGHEAEGRILPITSVPLKTEVSNK